MILSQIRLRNFRNHADSSVEFGDGITALLGNNGQGKTNLLEAISYLSLTKSFYAASDAYALQIGKPLFEVEGTMVSASGIASSVRVRYERESGSKEYTLNHTQPETLSSVVGMFPVVILAPENASVTFGGPAERRKFVDLVLSQLSPSYLEDVLEYRRILRQRNRILADARAERRAVAGMIEAWSLGLVRYGARLIHRRVGFLREFESYVTAAYRELAPDHEEPALAYRGTFAVGEGGAPDAIEAAMSVALADASAEEQRRGLTLIGPHRDELELRIGGMVVQQYASQGQHKSLLVALKVAEYHFLKERRGESPIFLLDDVFSELDEMRSQRLLELIGRLGQSVVTATGEHVFHGSVRWNGQHRRYRIEQGTCTPVSGRPRVKGPQVSPRSN